MLFSQILLLGGLLTGRSLAQSTQGIYDLVQRRMPQHADSFQFLLDNSTDQSHDHYVVSTLDNGTVSVQGNSLSALSSGLHRYLTDAAGVDMWWFIGNRLHVAPQQLPPLQQPIEGSSVVKWRYHFNTVTFSYLASFWNWEDWEFQLDWMALRGINLPLTWIGFEKILVEVFQEIGLTDAEIIGFLSGPAFQAFNRMGNIQGSWGGELPYSWIESQFALQNKIIVRMVELGMTPVLPGFAGFVPPNITRVLPGANVTQGSVWNGFSSEYTSDTFLEPLDKNFTDLQCMLISKQQAYYGNVTHIYALDQYNELTPSSTEPGYLHNISQATINSLKAADPDAIWLLQGWLFRYNPYGSFWDSSTICAYLSGVENTDMIVLDLFAESEPVWQNTSSFYGKPWIWCQVHDFGGNMGVYGQIMNITINSTEALAQSSSLIGFGHTMESQEGNEIMYDLLLDQAWSQSPIDTVQYFHDWVDVRYAGSSWVPLEMYQAWEILRETAYNNTDLSSDSVPKSILELRPDITGLVDQSGHHPTAIHYDPKLLVKAYQLMYDAAAVNPALYFNPAWEYDFVFLVRQIFANDFIPRYNEVISNYTSTCYNPQAINSTGGELIDLMYGLDSLLRTNENFHLDSWINRAVFRAQGNKTLAEFYEYDARNQITLWGPRGELTDYASKQWSGLVRSYYLPRWQMFLAYLQKTRPQNADMGQFHEQLLVWEQNWQLRNESMEDKDTQMDLPTVLENMHNEWPDLFGLRYQASGPRLVSQP
ncbi:hypothetical protein N7490_009724 [Penicillium lividum]|nr:hypothetical protein N7490_009724 [Penicillium lividum]